MRRRITEAKKISDNNFEKRVGEVLRATRGLFVYHPPDGIAMQWRPGDFLWGSRKGWGIIEAKEVNGEVLPASRWTPQQRGFAERVTLTGGTYYLIVRFVGVSIDTDEVRFKRKVNFVERFNMSDVGHAPALRVGYGWLMEKLDFDFLVT
jgi:hypothetical protein